MLRASLERFRLIRERTLNQVQGLSQEQMDFSPPSGEWSIGEILDHLRLGERVFRKDFADLIDRAKAGQTPHIYRSFAEMNAAPAFIPQCALPFLCYGQVIMFAYASDAAVFPRVTNTGHGARRTTFSATLPMRAWINPVRPCVPITIISTFSFPAISTMD
jgi:hypothetical protein